MNKILLGVLLMVCVQIGFGGYSVVLAVYGKGHINPVVFSLFRDSCAFPILLTAAYLKEGLRIPRRKDLPLFLSMGIIGIFGNQVMFIIGLYSAGADIASIFQPSIPVFTVIVALVARQEMAPLLCGRGRTQRNSHARHNYVEDGRTVLSGWFKVIGILLVCVGGCVMVLSAPEKNTAAAAHSVLLGEFLLLGNCMCMAVYIIIQKKYIFNNDQEDSWKDTPVNVTAWSYMFGAVFMALASAYCGASDPSVFDVFPKSLPPCVPRARANQTSVDVLWCNAHSGDLYNTTVKSLCSCATADYESFLIPLFYAAFVSSSMCYGFVTIANKHLPSTVVAGFWPMQVPAAVTLNYIVNAETITLGQGLGGLLIIVALFAVVLADAMERKQIAALKTSLNEESRLLASSRCLEDEI